MLDVHLGVIRVHQIGAYSYFLCVLCVCCLCYFALIIQILIRNNLGHEGENPL